MLTATQQIEQSERGAPRAEDVGLERLLDDPQIGVDRTLVGVVVDRRVVDQHVDVIRVRADRVGERRHVSLGGHIQLHRDYPAGGWQRLGRLLCLGRGSRREHDEIPARGELTRQL